MSTLEGCATSQTKQLKIIEESVKMAKQRELIIREAFKSKKILVKTPNVCNHIMQDHHQREKILKLTGDKVEDFKKVLKLIEDNNIVHKSNIKDTFQHRYLPMIVHEYGKTVSGQEVRVFMESYTDKGETFLKNAYIKTR